MTHRLFSSVLLGVSCCTLLLVLGEATPAAGQSPRIKGKLNVVQGNQRQQKTTTWEPQPWGGFPQWHGGSIGGIGHIGGIGGFGGHIGGGTGAFSIVPAIAGAVDSLPGMSPFGGPGIPNLGNAFDDRRGRSEERLLLGSLGAFGPGLDLFRDPVWDLVYPEDDVAQLLRVSRTPGVRLPQSRGLNALLMLDDDFAPFGTSLRNRSSFPGLRGDLSAMLGGFDAFSHLQMFESLNRGRYFSSPSGFGLPGGYSSQMQRLLQMIEGPGYGFGQPYLGRAGGYGGGFYFPDVFPLYGPEFYLPGGMQRRGIGGFGGLGYGGFGRPVVIAPSPPRPRGPSAEEQRTAMAQFHKSLVAVEAMARAGAWDALGEGLSKTLQGGSLPGAVAEPLKALRTEATRITELFKLRDALARGWDTPPDAAGLAKQVESLRADTGDTDLADRLIRLLAVKARWEGHDAAATALSASGVIPDIDSELEDLRKLRSIGTELVSITTQDDRELARRRVVRGVLEEIDHHIDCDRYTAAVHVKDIQQMRSKAKELAGLSPKKSAATSTAPEVAVRKALGRPLNETDMVVLRKMHAAGKSVEAIIEALR